MYGTLRDIDQLDRSRHQELEGNNQTRRGGSCLSGEARSKPQVFYTMGKYDLVLVADMPNDEALLQFNLAVGSLGNVRTNTLKTWTEAEFANVVAKL